MELTFAARQPDNRMYRIVPIHSLTTYAHLQTRVNWTFQKIGRTNVCPEFDRTFQLRQEKCTRRGPTRSESAGNGRR